MFGGAKLVKKKPIKSTTKLSSSTSANESRREGSEQNGINSPQQRLETSTSIFDSRAHGQHAFVDRSNNDRRFSSNNDGPNYQDYESTMNEARPYTNYQPLSPPRHVPSDRRREVSNSSNYDSDPSRPNPPSSRLISTEIVRSASGTEPSQQPYRSDRRNVQLNPRSTSNPRQSVRPERRERPEAESEGNVVIMERRRDMQSSTGVINQSRSREESYHSFSSSSPATPPMQPLTRDYFDGAGPAIAQSPSFYRKPEGFSPESGGEDWKRALGGYRTPVVSPTIRSPLSNSIPRKENYFENVGRRASLVAMETKNVEAFNRMRIESHQSSGYESKRQSIETWQEGNLEDSTPAPIPFATRRLSNSFIPSTSYSSTDPAKQLFVDSPLMPDSSVASVGPDQRPLTFPGLPTPPSSIQTDHDSIHQENEYPFQDRPSLPPITTNFSSLDSASPKRPPLPSLPTTPRRRSITSQESGRARSNSNRSMEAGELPVRIRRSIIEVAPIHSPRPSGWERFEFGLTVYPEKILCRLLHHIDYFEFRSLRMVSRTMARLLEREKELILCRFLGSFGYRSFGSTNSYMRNAGKNSIIVETSSAGREDVIQLEFRDLDAFQINFTYSVSDYAKFSRSHLHKPLQSNTLSAIRASTRAFNRVVLRIRLQSTLDAADPLLIAKPSYLFHGLEEKRKISIHKAGRAAQLKVWIPTSNSHWLSDQEVVECEREIWRGGVTGQMKRGDVVWNIAMGDFGNEGKLIYDGRYLRDLQHTWDHVGHLPAWLNSLSFSPSYYHNVIASSSPNPVFFLTLSPFLNQIRESLALCQDQVSMSSPQSEYIVKRFVYRARMRIRSGEIISTSGVTVVHEDWVGELVLETQGTTEHAAALLARCAAFETTSAWRILREKSRAGKIWLTPVSESERIN